MTLELYHAVTPCTIQAQQFSLDRMLGMPKKIAPLSAVEVSRIDTRGMHAVGGVAGLLLQVAKGGSRSWVLRARIGNKRRDIGLGGYPDVTLSQARTKARNLREQISGGADPIAERRAARQALEATQAKRLTFAEAARRKHAAIESEFRNAKHRKDWLSSLERHAFPTIGELDVADIGRTHIMAVLEPIWHTKTETATRVRQRLENVLAWATVSGYREGANPAEWKGNLSALLAQPSKVRKRNHYPALPWQQMPSFMAALAQRKGIATRALEFTILTAARSSEIRGMKWAEVDLKAATWTVPDERIKAGKEHIVPLSSAALAILNTQPRMADSEYVFPAARGGMVSDMSLTAVVRRLHNADVKAGGKGYVDPKQNNRVATVHGFRSSFKDWARNRTSYADEVSELALAHVNSDATRAAYARDGLLPQRTRLMAEWATFCASPALESASVTAIGEARA